LKTAVAMIERRAIPKIGSFVSGKIPRVDN
jgi:hypothetical protein